MIILGIDPGTATTGYGIIKNKTDGKNKKSLSLIDYGTITTNKSSSAEKRLKIINDELNGLIKKHRPDILAIENIFFFKNLKTVVAVSQSKGVILLAAANKKIPIYEFTPLEVKMTITGYGRAEKKQIQEMVKILLNLKEVPKPDDAADALAVAVCGSLKIESLKRLNKN